MENHRDYEPDKSKAAWTFAGIGTALLFYLVQALGS